VNADLEQVKAAVLGDGGCQVLHLLDRLQAGESPRACDRPVLDRLEACGLYQSQGEKGRLTSLGHKCATPAREYVFWIRRGRRLHGQGECQVLSLDTFRDKSVLELGPGWGCNLLSLRPVARRVCGVEIEPLYVEFSKMIAEREGVPAPEIRIGMAEDLPVESEDFDWVVLFSALQYMDIGRTVREIARVLKPGGLVLSTQKTLGMFLRQATREGLRSASLRAWISNCGVVLDSLASGWNGSRVRKIRNMRPAYPTSRGLARQFARAGLVPIPELSFEHPRMFFGLVAEKACDEDLVEARAGVFASAAKMPGTGTQ
jgi:SAM-dependent methyltransferase